MRRLGFTLIELIVVIAIIAILAAIITPNAFKAIEKANISATIEDYRSIKTAAMAYYADVGDWPCNGVTNVGFVAGPSAANPCAAGTPVIGGWDGPYLEKWPPRARWGGGAYAYVEGSESAVGNYDWNNNGVISGTTEVRVVTISNMPVGAVQRIETHLDGTANPGTTDSNGSARYGGSPLMLYLLISTD